MGLRAERAGLHSHESRWTSAPQGQQGESQLRSPVTLTFVRLLDGRRQQLRSESHHMEAKDPKQSIHPTSTRRWRAWRVAPLIAALAALAVGAAACTSAAPHAGSGSSGSSAPGSSTSSVQGSSVPDSSGSSVSNSSGGPPGVNVAQVLKYWQCMQSHGEGGSEPHLLASPNGFMGFMSPLSPNFDPQSPTFLAAQQACKQYNPLTGVETPAEQAQNVAAELKFARCMRAHGVLDLPDPSSDGGLRIPNSVDENSATFQAADSACQSLLTGGSGS
jgi:hypothetical protein